jgi:hypothetical protein
MSTCADGVYKAITSDCSTQGVAGLYKNAYIYNREDLVLTKTANKITVLTTKAATKGYLIKGVKNNINAGFDLVSAEDRADRYTGYFSFHQFEIDADNAAAIAAIKDAVVVVELNQTPASGDGKFQAYGIETGLYKTSHAKRVNDANGAATIELATRAGQEESYPYYTVFVTSNEQTRAALVTSMSVPA